MDDLTGKIAVITGGGSGIGREIALSFAGAGMHVVVADLDLARAKDVAGELTAKGTQSLAVQVDVAEAASVEALADAAYAKFGAVHVLCNNAGVVHFGPLAEVAQADWDWLFRVNVWGVVNGVRTFVPRMKAQGGPGHIVNTASMAGVFALPGLGVYTASKYAVMGISETLRQELAGDQIGVSVLCPGPTPSRIGEAARSNVRLDGSRREPSTDPVDQGIAEWREASVVAQAVLDGVKANRAYIFSHAPSKGAAERRFNAMLADFDHAP